MLVGEVTPSPRDAFMDAGDNVAPLGTFRSALRFVAEATLSPGKRPFFDVKEARMGNRCARAKGGKGVAKVMRPTSMPTGCTVSGRADGSAHSHEKQTYHLPVRLRMTVAVLGGPSSGRCRMIFTWPTPYSRTRRASASNLQPTGTCWYLLVPGDR